MEFFIAYVVMVAVAVSIVATGYLFLDHWLESRRQERMLMIVDNIVIPRVMRRTKQMSIDMIREINDEVFRMAKEGEP